MNLKLKIWRQPRSNAPGEFKDYQVTDITDDMSFLEMLDALNEDLNAQGEAPVAFEHDCREGICGSCGFLINGVAHGGSAAPRCASLRCGTKDGDHLMLEPWRQRVSGHSGSDRQPLSVRSSFRPEGSSAQLLEAHPNQFDSRPQGSCRPSFDAAACIGCGACVAACPNAAAMLFTSAKLTHLNSFPGKPQRDQRTRAWWMR